jgi:uncharacterized membrane protein
VDITVFYATGISVVVIVVIVILVAIILASIGGAKKGKIHGAGVIMIGPIPIIFGTDKKSIKFMLALALSLTIMVLIITVVCYWLLR